MSSSITQTTYNFAEKRNISLWETYIEAKAKHLMGKFCVWISEEGAEEPDFIYIINRDGTFSFYKSAEDDSDAPARIMNQKDFRAFLDLYSKNKSK